MISVRVYSLKRPPLITTRNEGIARVERQHEKGLLTITPANTIAGTIASAVTRRAADLPKRTAESVDIAASIVVDGSCVQATDEAASAEKSNSRDGPAPLDTLGEGDFRTTTNKALIKSRI